ncbi:MAG: hypothetical protein ACE5FL_10470, partial [Myxococcota bacterium]
HLYRDVVSHTGPLPYELLAALFRVFGAKLLVARGAVVVLQAVATAAVFASARRGGAGPLAHPAAAVVAAAPLWMLPLLSIYYYSNFAFYLGLLAVYAGVRALHSDAWAVATGVLISAIALCKQNTGAQLGLVLLPAMAFACDPGSRARRASYLLLGGAAVAAATLVGYALRGDLSALVTGQVELPIAIASTTSFHTPRINFWPPGVLDPAIATSAALYLPGLYLMVNGLVFEAGPGAIAFTQLLYALPVVALIATAARAFAARLHPATWLHGAFLVAMTASLYPRADWGHLVIALPPALVQALLLCAPARSPAARGAFRRALAASLSVALAVTTIGLAVWLHAVSGPAALGPAVPLRPVSPAYRGPALPRVVQFLRQRVRPGEAIFVARQEPLLYFATGTRNPTRFEGVLPGLRSWQEPEILAALDEVRFVVMSDIDQPTYTFYSEELPAVWRALERHFRVPRGFPVDDHSWITVLARGPDRGETALDFVDAQDRGRAWVRGENGRERPAMDRPRRMVSRLLNRPLAIALGPGGGGIDFDIDVPPDAIFQAGVGYRGLLSADGEPRPHVHPPGTTLGVSVGRGGAFTSLASLRIDDGHRAGRTWTPLEADLSEYAGERVTLRLEVAATRPLPEGALSWFGSPRIARPSGAASR